jgi:hypothetical protein
MWFWFSYDFGTGPRLITLNVKSEGSIPTRFQNLPFSIRVWFHPVLERRPGSLVPDRFSGRGNGTSGFLHDDPGTRPTRVVTLRKCSSKYATPLVTRLDGRETGPIRQRAEGGVSPRPSDLGYHYICTLQLQWKNTSSRHSTTPFRPHAPAPTP